MNELGLVGRLGAPWLAAALWLGSLGCTGGGDDGRGMGGEGGEGGSAARGGSGGGGQGGDEGMGGEGGASTQRTAVETCEAWCRNEARGPSCCVQDPFFGGNCLEGCYDRCENTVAATACVEEWAAARECQLELACDDFFLECEPLNIRFNGCEARINAERNGSCTAAAEGCAITEAECLATFDVASIPCLFGWEDYLTCASDNFATCEECVGFTEPFGEDCGWPSSAGTDVPFVPKSCDTFSLPPAGCGGPCPGGSDTECGGGTYCDETVCEANCIANGDCARGEACSVRGRCLPTVGGSPLSCSWFDDPPAGCGASCPGGSNLECPTGTFCAGEVCDAICRSDAQCLPDERCNALGLCEEVPLAECSDGRSLDETFTSDSASFTCSLLGVFDAVLEAVLTASPTAPLVAGSNTYDLQLSVTFDENTADFFDGLGITLLRFQALAGSVVPSLGTASGSTAELVNDPLPCDVSVRASSPVTVVMPMGQATWNLDVGSTQEISLEDVSLTIEAPGAGIEVPLSTEPGGDCAWDMSPPSVSFALP